MDDAAAQRNAQQMEELVADTSALSNVLKRRIKSLERQGGSGRDGQIRKQQVRLAGSIVVSLLSSLPRRRSLKRNS